MNFLRKLLPDDPTECKNYLSPSTCLTLDNEISGILWVCYYFIFITRILPGGIQFEIHVNVNEEEGDRPDEFNVVAGADDGVQEDVNGLEDTDEEDESFQALPFHLLREDDEDDSSSDDDSSDDDETHVNIDVSLRVVT